MTVWNDAGFRHLAAANWMANIAVQVHHNRRATGDPGREWLGSRVVQASSLRPEAGRRPVPHHLRMLRVALASTLPRRRNLFHESRWRSALESFRTRGRDPWAWIEARAAHADSTVRALIRTAATLAPGA